MSVGPIPGAGASASATSGAVEYPWLVDINPRMTPIAVEDGPWSVANRAYSDSIINSATGANPNSAAWDVVLGAGTWTIEVKFQAATDAGIATVQLDDGAGNYTNLGSIDFYNGGAVGGDKFGSVTGVVIASTIKRRLRLRATTKHASATSYFLRIQAIQLRRTA